MANMRAAFQGERGAFSEVAAQKFLGENVTPIACDSFASLFDYVEKGKQNMELYRLKILLSDRFIKIMTYCLS